MVLVTVAMTTLHPFDWVAVPMILAYGVFAFSLLCFVAAVRGRRFPGAKQQVAETPKEMLSLGQFEVTWPEGLLPTETHDIVASVTQAQNPPTVVRIGLEPKG
jgi:hypothetical protein